MPGGGRRWRESKFGRKLLRGLVLVNPLFSTSARVTLLFEFVCDVEHCAAAFFVTGRLAVGPRICRQGERAYATTPVSFCGHKQLQCGWEFGGFQEYTSRGTGEPTP
ncbi:hypothetical protein NOF04DRAFT_21584 [Fusarium oxysporum II5]|uniref:Uncharacterized protein n=2 Tax=Fusarium oxysporum species complex TaxID=171631 RepID=X0J1U9_FUSO5|nr:uncharacterized protein FOIG_16504 [Fusarium odoratissimum NRRL 54006]EXL90235.1 hypothetical protein FOIG_16504 [Fusarium odoratissimum NRRL 54006]KAK2134301.1 hypothetical protein NOF04DRAFT_21584 [Fusarium oxysporum II5]TXB97414.1 hypothetical protein FocTR4_00012289 [Fusarium oxysporum f. sp. cubense]